MYYVGSILIYIALSIAFIADVLRNRYLSTAGKIGWTLALLFIPVFSWAAYGYVRLRQKRGL